MTLVEAEHRSGSGTTTNTHPQRTGTTTHRRYIQTNPMWYEHVRGTTCRAPHSTTGRRDHSRRKNGNGPTPSACHLATRQHLVHRPLTASSVLVRQPRTANRAAMFDIPKPGAAPRAPASPPWHRGRRPRRTEALRHGSRRSFVGGSSTPAWTLEHLWSRGACGGAARSHDVRTLASGKRPSPALLVRRAISGQLGDGDAA